MIHLSDFHGVTRAYLDSIGWTLLACEQCGAQKIGPVGMRICRTCNPVPRGFPLKKRKGLKKRAPRAFCLRGHEMTEENKYRKRSGYIVCRTCKSKDTAAWNARHAEQRKFRMRLARRLRRDAGEISSSPQSAQPNQEMN